MEETLNPEVQATMEEEQSSFNFQAIFRTLVLNWYWFVLTVIISVGAAYVYLRYTTPTYQARAKLLIKENNERSSRNTLNSSTLGMISNASNIDNEIEILGSHDLAAKAVRSKKLYVTYYREGRVKDVLEYRYQPMVADIDSAHLEELRSPIRLTLSRKGNKYSLSGTYFVPDVERDTQEGPYSIQKELTSMDAVIPTRAGTISIHSNQGRQMRDGETYFITIYSPNSIAYKFAGSLAVSQGSKTTSIAMLSLVDENAQRAIDYLHELAEAYNQQANDDKNEVATKTDRFINARLEKINEELGKTEGDLQNYKQDRGMIELKMNASAAMSGQSTYENQLTEMGTQIALFESIIDFMKSSGKYEIIPSNVGLQDESVSSLISKYNELVLERKRLLRSASEMSPVVEPITEQIDDLRHNISRAIGQSSRALEIQRNAILAQYDKYSAKVAETPQQERDLTQIGRQQEVMSGLYLMLLQKREENNISLAATANKGQLIDEPQFAGQVSPNRNMILLIALAIGLLVPALILFLIEFFRYKIEGHEDVAKLTKLPIIADVAVANDSAKTKADIVVHENQNNTMEEIFRSLRTNLLFMFKEGQKVVMLTSSNSGEGKTFIAANLSISLALLGKRTVLIGLDIRKPRLAELFEIPTHKMGITNLLMKNDPTLADVREQIVSSGINGNLDLLMAGPIPPNPAELLERKSLDKIFQVLREEYDYVVIDTAPVGLVTDTLSIGRVSDATICVCRADYTAKDDISAFDALSKEKKLPNMCIVINGIDMSKKKYGYRYGYGRYGKYGRYGYGRKGYGYGYGYGTYGTYGRYSSSHYGQKDDNSVKH